jgi:hypothetical protein
VVGVTERVPLNLRVHPTVKEAYDDELIEKYGVKRPYAGIEVEREARREFCDGEIGDLAEAVDDVLDETEASPRKKDLPPTPTGGDTVVVRYRVHEDVRAAIMQRADEGTRTAGEIVGGLMWDYALRGGIDEKLRRKLEAARDELAEDDVDDEPKSTAGKIADRLGDPFTLDEFHDAAEAEGVGTPSYRVETYLPKVLEITGTVPVPTRKRDEFIRESAVSGHQNPAYLPYPAMDDDDKRLAIKAEALRRAANLSDRNGIKFDATDAREALGGRAPSSLIKRLFREIADDVPDDRYGGPEIRYKPDEGVLSVSKRKLEKNSGDHLEALKVAGVIEPDQGTDPGTSEDDDTTEPTTPDATTSSTAPPARADGGETGDDADRDELKEEAEERLSELSEVPADA